MKTTLLKEIASRLVAIENCRKSNNTEWETKHGYALDELESELPHGSGFDKGTTIDRESSGRKRLILHTAFHHMNNGGYYDGWTEHRIVVTPDLMSGFILSVGGRNRNDIKEYIHEQISFALAQEIDTATFYGETLK